MIEPTVGRVVWYHPQGHSETHAAIIARVNNDETINIAWFDVMGGAQSAQSVPLIQDAPVAQTGSAYCEWMPYQKGQAAKTEAAENAAVDKGK